MSTYTLPDYMREDAEVTEMLRTRDYRAYIGLLHEYPHPDDQSVLTNAWNAGIGPQTERIARRCRDCGAPGATYRGLGIDCGCAAEASN